MDLRKLILSEFNYYGQQANPTQILAWVEELKDLDEEDVEQAYRLLRKKNFTKVPLPSDIYGVIFNYPSSDEAWSMIPRSEGDNVVWCDPIRIAYGISRELLETDEIAARMAFKKAYESQVLRAISNLEKPKWIVSYGTDKESLDDTLRNAIERGWLTDDVVKKYSPNIQLSSRYNDLQIEGPKITPEIALENIQKIKDLLNGKK